jgi:glycosyltransferase involved in cell wall biosynthesis
MKLSAVVLARNEEKNIERCLKSLRFCDEIVIVDDNSADSTEKIAKEYKTKIYKRSLDSDFSAQRNFGMEKATGDWILFVDADEEVTVELAEEIKKNLEGDLYNGFLIKRRDFWWGQELKYGETMKVRSKGLVRLVKKSEGKWLGTVHEVLDIVGLPGMLKNYLNHYPHPTIKDFLEEVNYYSTLRAKELLNKKVSTNAFQIIMFPLGKFILTYFFKLGFLDGPAGFAYAFFMSFHSFLVRAKLYQYSNFNETIK